MIKISFLSQFKFECFKFLFLYLVAFEATAKYFHRGVVVEVSTKHEARDDLPAVTLCAYSAQG